MTEPVMAPDTAPAPAPAEAPDAPRFERPRRIGFGDCDPAGIVFYPRYYAMFQALVEDWFNEGLGIAYHQVLGARRTGLPTVHIRSDFQRPGRLGEWLRLSLQLQHLGRSAFTLQLQAHGADDGALRLASTQVLVCTSLDSHRAQPVPPDLRAAMQHWLAPGAASPTPDTERPT